MSDIKILLVDDDEVDRELVRKALRSLEAQIIEAATGKACLDELGQTTFSLILLDYKLPDYDGMALIGDIRRLADDTPIIVVTGFGNEDLVMSTSMAGVLDYIPKNKITPEFLTRTILNDLLIHQAHKDKARVERELADQRKQNMEMLQSIIDMAKAKLAEYDRL